MGKMELANILFLPSSFAGVLAVPGERNPVKLELRQPRPFSRATELP